MNNYILDGHEPKLELDFVRWAKWFQTANRVVEQTVVANDVRVSTVFLGIDHNIEGIGDPILFETMIFGGYRDEEQFRYTTWDAAKFGHDEIIKEFSQRCLYCGTLRIKDNVNCSGCGAPY